MQFCWIFCVLVEAAPEMRMLVAWADWRGQVEPQMLLALEGLFGEQQTLENKTFPIWLLNSKYFLPSAEMLPRVLLLKQTWTYGVLMAGVVCCRIRLLRGGGSIWRSAQSTACPRIFAESWDFTKISVVGIESKLSPDEVSRSSSWAIGQQDGSGSGLHSRFPNGRNYMFVRSVFWVLLVL